LVSINCRATLQPDCFFVIEEYVNPALESIGYEVNAIMSYDNTTKSTPPIGEKHNLTNPYNGTCGDVPPSLLVPAVPSSPGNVSADNFQYITYGFFQAQVSQPRNIR
jgi:hypothetical protein